MPGFRSLDQEVTDYRLPVEGSIPDWLDGTLVRNGPGKFEAGEKRFNHWFDGLAMLRRYSFADGEVRLTNRFLRTEAYERARSGELAGQFGTGESGWRKVLAWLRNLGPPTPTDNANVHVAAQDDVSVNDAETERKDAQGRGPHEGPLHARLYARVGELFGQGPIRFLFGRGRRGPRRRRSLRDGCGGRRGRA